MHRNEGTYIVPADAGLVLLDELKYPTDLVKRGEVLPSIDEGVQSLSPQSSRIACSFLDQRSDSLVRAQGEEYKRRKNAHGSVRSSWVGENEVLESLL